MKVQGMKPAASRQQRIDALMATVESAVKITGLPVAEAIAALEVCQLRLARRAGKPVGVLIEAARIAADDPSLSELGPS